MHAYTPICDELSSASEVKEGKRRRRPVRRDDHPAQPCERTAGLARRAFGVCEPVRHAHLARTRRLRAVGAMSLPPRLAFVPLALTPSALPLSVAAAGLNTLCGTSATPSSSLPPLHDDPLSLRGRRAITLVSTMLSLLPLPLSELSLARNRSQSTSERYWRRGRPAQRWRQPCSAPRLETARRTTAGREMARCGCGKAQRA